MRGASGTVWLLLFLAVWTGRGSDGVGWLDAEDFEVSCPGNMSAASGHQADEDLDACGRELFENSRELLGELSGYPTTFGRDGPDRARYDWLTEDQYYRCVKRGFRYMRTDFDVGTYLARSAATGDLHARDLHARWMAVPEHDRSTYERVGLCVPRSCPKDVVESEVATLYVRYMLHADLGGSMERVSMFPVPEGGEITVEEFFAASQAHEQGLWNNLFEDYQKLRATLEDPEDFVSQLDVSICWRDFTHHVDALHAASSLGEGGARAGATCVRRGQTLLRVEFRDWCGFDATERGPLRKALAAFRGRQWLDHGAPMHVCTPTQCGDAALRSAVLPYYTQHALDTGAFIRAAGKSRLFQSPAAVAVDVLTDWTEVPLAVAVVGFAGVPFDALVEALAGGGAGNATLSAGGLGFRVYGPDSVASRVLLEAAEIDGEAFPRQRQARALREDGAEEVRHVLRLLRCDAKLAPKEHAACLAKNEVVSGPLSFALEWRRALADSTLVNNPEALLRLSRIPGLKVLVTLPSWGRAPALLDESQLHALGVVRTTLGQSRLFIAEGHDAAEVTGAALRFLGTGAAPAAPLAGPAVAAADASARCQREVKRHWRSLWPMSGASLPGRQKTNGAAATTRWDLPSSLLADPEQVRAQVAACEDAGHVYWELRCAAMPAYLARCAKSWWQVPPLLRATRAHMSRVGICLPAPCDARSALPALPAWISRWLAAAVLWPGASRHGPTRASSQLLARPCAPPRASEARLVPFNAPVRLAPTPRQLWPKHLQEAACEPGARRRRSAVLADGLGPTGCSCEAEATPCVDAAVCTAALLGGFGARAGAGGARLAIVNVHDLQIPFDENDDREFRRYVRPVHSLFYDQAGLRALREHHPRLEHVLMVPAPHLAKHPLSDAAREGLRARGVRVVEVPWLHPPLTESVVRETTADDQTFGPAEFVRLHLWNLTEYDAVLYIDHDMLLTGDVTPLLLCSLATGMYLTTSGITTPLNLGLHALRPNGGVFRALVDVATRAEYFPDLGFTATGHRSWGIVDGWGQTRGSAHAGLQGFLYYFFFMPDGVVRDALRRWGVPAALAAQVERCVWNYSKEHLMYRYMVEESDQKPPESMLFRCKLGSLGFPRIVHKLDEAMLGLLLRNVSVQRE